MNSCNRFCGACCALFFVLSLSLPLHAQDQFGMRFERSAGLYGATLNPAQLAFMSQPWEINLVAADAFLENNYGFITNTGLLRLIRHAPEITEMNGDAADQPYTSGGMQLGYFSGKGRMHGIAQARISGPGFAARIGKHHVIGLSTSLRAQASTYRLPESIQGQNLKNRQMFDPLVINPLSAGLLAWGEIGLPYCYHKSGDALSLSFGLTPKLLFGLEAGFVRSTEKLEFSWAQLDSLKFSSGNWDVAMTTGNVGSVDQMRSGGNSGSGNMTPQINGYGAGLDAGIMIAMPRFDNGSESDYCWRLGVSFTDLGMIHFKRQAEHHVFRFDSSAFFSKLDYLGQTNIDSILLIANQNLLGSIGSSLQATSFDAATPAAMVIQFDYRLASGFYLGSLFIQRLPMGKFKVQHSNTFGIMPRFESRWFSVSTPLILNDWQSFRVGFSARLGWLTLGTDNLNSYFRQEQFTGSDFYIGLKINGWMPSHRKQKNREERQNMRKIICFRF